MRHVPHKFSHEHNFEHYNYVKYKSAAAQHNLLKNKAQQAEFET